jgi:RNA polymerase sigma factor (sigma-70 family)
MASAGMSEEPSIQELIERLRDGDNQAANEIVNRFGDRLVSLARSRLDRLILRKLDPEDVVQSVCRSALARLSDGRLTVNDWNSLWKLLVCITVNKCCAQAEFFRAARRDVHREVDVTPRDEDSGADFQPADDEPSPLEATLLVEAVQQLLDSFRDPKHRTIVQLRLQHYSPPEIALEVGVSERTVHRVLDRVKMLLRQQIMAA